jgi:hypothetical protein
MKTHRRTAGAVVLAGLLSVTAAAFAASPDKGAQFKGTASGRVTFATSFTAKDPLSYAVSTNGKKLLNLKYTDKVCGFSSVPVKVGTISVSADGKFSVSKRKSAREPEPTSGTARTTTTITGKFLTAKKAKGTLDYSQKGTNGRCGPIKLKFTATATAG